MTRRKWIEKMPVVVNIPAEFEYYMFYRCHKDKAIYILWKHTRVGAVVKSTRDFRRVS
jgi:hypothetical protein